MQVDKSNFQMVQVPSRCFKVFGGYAKIKRELESEYFIRGFKTEASQQNTEQKNLDW